MLIASLVGTVLSIIGIGLLILLAVYVVNIVFSIIAAVKANKGSGTPTPFDLVRQLTAVCAQARGLVIVGLMDAPLWLGMTVFCVGFVGLSWSCWHCGAGSRAWRTISRVGPRLSYAVGAYGVFYGVTLALIAAASYSTYADVDQVASMSPPPSPCSTARRRTFPSRNEPSSAMRSSPTRGTSSRSTGRSRLSSSSR
jgi:hypothetical protein